jgi:ABC-type molybdenum transport system ATPase subunit/photorepair protein PhrA
MKETLNELILSGFYNQSGITDQVKQLQHQILAQEISAFEAAEKIYQQFSR